MRITKKLRLGISAFLVVAMAFISTNMASAWGPTRTTFTMNEPATYVTFNSIIDNPTVGDERNFVRVREANTDNTYVDTLEIQPGKEYEVWIMYHNNAASNYNASGKGIANGTKVKSSFPGKVTKGNKGQINGVISAVDAEPESVWDEAYLTTQYDEVLLSYKPGSAKIHNAGAVNDSVLPETLFTEEGAYLGINVLDGRIPGCAEYSGYIKYTLVAENVGARVDKTASLDGEAFSKTVNAKLGDIVTYQVIFSNTGTRDLTNVTFHDVLPAGMSLVSKSAYLYNDAHKDGQNLVDDLIAKNGYNTGLYSKQATAKIVYQVKIDNNSELCGKTLTNRMYVDHDAGEIYDGANVKVNCDGQVTPDEPTVETCQNEDGTIKNTPECNKCYNEDGTLKDIPECKCYNEDGSVKDIPECKNSVMPSELPSTGPTEVVMTVVLLTGAWVMAAYWYASHRELRKIKKNL